MPKRRIRATIEDLHRIRFGGRNGDIAEQAQILAQLTHEAVSQPTDVLACHAIAMAIHAFPCRRKNDRLATDILSLLGQQISQMKDRKRGLFQDTGLLGTKVVHAFSYEIARWLVDKFGESVDISWPDYETPEQLDPVLAHLLLRSELSAFEEGTVDTKTWLRLAKGDSTKTDLAWLLDEMACSDIPASVLNEAYTTAEVPLVWRLDHALASKSDNRVAMKSVAYRGEGLRVFHGCAAQEITKPLRGIRKLSRIRAQEVIDVARVSLASRQREVYAISQANVDEVYLAPLGKNVHVAIIGVVPAARLSLEANYGYLLLSNGVPIGYGGVSPLFRQANTGINIFDEFRGAESATLWVQALRAFRQLFQCHRFIVNPYQFGKGNSEAVGSGAFWFYYKLGFRPIDADIRALAAREKKRCKKNSGHRTDRKTLRQLAQSDLELRLPGSSQAERFEERWLETLSLGSTQLLASQSCSSRRLAMRRVVRALCRILKINSRHTWPSNERESFELLAPVIGLVQTEIENWSRREKSDLVKLMRAKGARGELDFARCLANHDRLRQSLARYCRRAE